MIRIDIYTSDYKNAHEAYASSPHNVSAIYCKGTEEEIQFQHSASIEAIEAANDLTGVHIRYDSVEIDS